MPTMPLAKSYLLSTVSDVSDYDLNITSSHRKISCHESSKTPTGHVPVDPRHGPESSVASEDQIDSARELVIFRSGDLDCRLLCRGKVAGNLVIVSNNSASKKFLAIN